MTEQFGFTLMSPDEFAQWITKQNVVRTILTIQQHHTAVPEYVHFDGANHLILQRNMRSFHVNQNGWADIGQHFTIFPDGMIATGRSLERSPACIFGNNQNSICIENLGNFDTGKDIMRQEQRTAILRATAALCKRFNTPVNTDRIIYHHWFDLNTGARTNGTGVVKTCPGTGFFGGNKVKDAQDNFIPQVKALLSGTADPAAVTVRYYAFVNTPILNVRNAPSTSAKRISRVFDGAILRVYEEKDGWVRVSHKKQEWVSARFIQRVERGVVNTDSLNVRSGPGATFSKLGEIKAGEPVFVYERSGTWIRIDDAQRWVAEGLVSFE
jgi:uncharacterized protein YraI